MEFNKHFLKQAGIFLLFCIGFWAVSALYLNQALDNKAIQQGDMQQVEMMRYEGIQYREKTGQYPGWSPNIFGGMPANLINGTENGNWVYKSHVLELLGLVKTPFNFLYLAMLSMFVMLLAARVNKWMAAAGAIGYAFMTFTVSSYEAGHITKVLAMDVLPGFIAGLILLSRRKYLWGAMVTGLFFAAMIGFFHYQIAYYAAIIAVVFFIVEMIWSVRNKDFKHAIVASGLAILMTLVGVGTSISKIIDTRDYAKATMRGGSELASETPKNGPNQTVDKVGLEIGYAYAWSYSPAETFTLLIPRFMGGSSGERMESELSDDPEAQLPLYFGNLDFTSGPVYIGAIFIFLFILGIFIVVEIQNSTVAPEKVKRISNKFMIISVATLVISVLLSWGKYLGINEFIFHNLPYYNKFRTPMMALTIAQVVVPFFGLYALSLLFGSHIEKTRFNFLLKRSAIATGILFAIAAFILMSADFSSVKDKEMAARENGIETVNAIKSLRESAAWGDWMRSLFFIIAAFGLIWLTLKEKIKPLHLSLGLVALIALDMVGVSNRYLSDSNWVEKEETYVPVPSNLDQQIMKANTGRGRIYDLRVNPFNANMANPFHRNVGGYHPAKLSRYQDLISYGIVKNGANPSLENILKNNALDILNCRFVFVQNGNQEQPFERNTALGNAWFVQKAIEAPNAKAAIETLNTMHAQTEAVFESKEVSKPGKKEYAADTNSSMELVYFSPDTLTYTSNNTAEGLAVFSEVYYNENNGKWRAFIDGKEATVLRLNYIFRGLEIPANSKKVQFIYQKNIPAVYLAVENGTSSLLLLMLIGVVSLTAIGKVRAPNEDE